MSGGALRFEPVRRRRRLVSLTPMIDVVFLLLVFFMLVSRFALENAAELKAAHGGGAVQLYGPPRIVRIAPEEILLNGARITLEALVPALVALAPSPDAAIVIQIEEGVDVQQLVDVLDALEAAPLGPALVME